MSPDEKKIRIERKFYGLFAFLFGIILFWALYKIFQIKTDPLLTYAISPVKYYFYAGVFGVATMGLLTKYFELKQSKVCPLCKEYVSIDAVKCNHCGSDLPK